MSDLAFLQCIKYKNMDVLDDKYLNPQLQSIKKLVKSARVQNGLLVVNVPSAIQYAELLEKQGETLPDNQVSLTFSQRNILELLRTQGKPGGEEKKEEEN